MPVRAFDGTDDVIVTSGGAIGVPLSEVGGGVTWLAVFRPLALTGDKNIWSASANDSAMVGGYLDDGHLAWGTDSPGGDQRANPTIQPVVDTWTIWAMTKAQGANLVRHHAFQAGDDGWVHRNSSGTVGHSGNTCNRCQFGRFGGGGGFPQMHLAVAAIWTGVLSDGDIETIVDATTQILDLNPVAAWEFNQDDVSTPVVDIVGTADETSVVGTSVVDDEDLEWTFGLEGPGGEGSGDAFSGGSDSFEPDPDAFSEGSDSFDGPRDTFSVGAVVSPSSGRSSWVPDNENEAPEQGDFPTLATAGIWNEDLLEASAGFTAVADGTYENLDVTGVVLTGDADGAIFRNCRFNGDEAFWAVEHTDGTASVTFEDCEFAGWVDGDAAAVFNAGLAIVRRCYFHGAEDGVKIGANLYMEDSVVDNNGVSEEEDPHHDGLQIVSGGNVVIRHCYINLPDTILGTSAIIVKSDLGAIDDVLVEYCYLNGHSHTFTSTTGGFGTPTNVVVNYNRFGPDPAFDHFYASTGQTATGNVLDATGEPVAPPA